MSDTLMTVKEAAKYLNVHWQTVRNYIDRNDLPSHKIGKLVRIYKRDLDNFIKSQNEVTPNIEVELRYKLKDLKAIQKFFIESDIQPVHQSHIIDHWFIPIEIKNMKQQTEWFDVKRGCGLRIREQIDEYSDTRSTSLETKRLTLDMNHNTFLETSIKVDNYEATKELVEMMDRKEYLTIDKTRTMYKVDELKISIDIIKDFGTGMEIEYSGSQNRDEALSLIKNFAKKLGLEDKDLYEKSMTVDAMQTLARF